jgi:hypothetical protein
VGDIAGWWCAVGEQEHWRKELAKVLAELEAAEREAIKLHLARANVNSRIPSADTYAVVPVGKHWAPAVRGLSKEDALAAARDYRKRPSTRRGRGSSGAGPGRWTVVSDLTVSKALAKRGQSLAEAKVETHLKRERSRQASARYRERQRS